MHTVFKHSSALQSSLILQRKQIVYRLDSLLSDNKFMIAYFIGLGILILIYI